MKTKRSRIRMVLSILLLAALLVAAFYVPVVVSDVYDSRTLGQINTKKLDLNTYQAAYASFEEKLHAMGMAVAQGGEWYLWNEQDVAFPDTEKLSEQTMLQEMEGLLNEELLLNIPVNTFKPIDQKLVSMLCRTPEGTSLLPERQVYVFTYVSAEISAEEVTEYPELIYAIPHITLWVDAQFGKIYGFVINSMPADCMNLSTESWESVSIEALTNYWELGQEYQLDEEEKMAYDSWNDSYVWGQEHIFMGQDAYVLVYQEILWEKPNVSLRLGMAPFNYNIYETGYAISN